jgi:signal peptidase
MTCVPTAPPASPSLQRKHRPVHKRPPGIRIRRVLRVLSGVFLGLAVLAAILGAVAVVVMKIGFSPVLSLSMQPAFNPGDLVLTRAVPASNIAVGDIVVLPRLDIAGERYAHRIVALRIDRDQPVVRTKGDANPAPDPQELRITSDSVPVVVGDVPWVGEVALAGSRAPVRIGLIVLVGAAVLVAAKRALWRRST